MLLSLLLACPELGDTGDTERTGDTDSGDTDTSEPAETTCDDGTPVVPWTEAEESDALYATVTDFTLQTAAGDWRLSDHWTGCDSFLLIPSQPNQATGWPEHLWDQKRDTKGLFEALPRNTYVIFISSEKEEADRLAELALLDSGIENFLEDLSEEDRAYWEGHIVLATSDFRDAGGWLTDTLRSPNWGVGIDRFQRLRYIGSFANPERYNSSYGWFEPDISMAANEAVYYNYEAAREMALEAEGATVIPVFTGQEVSDPGWAGEMDYVTVELPDAATMQTFDTLTLDHYLGCVGDGEYGTCPAWDYINWLLVCDADQSNCVELGRYITTYHREGRWWHDVSALLPYFNEGGSFTFAYYTQQPYEVSLDLRLSNQGKDVRPQALQTFISGGYTGPTYNERDPVEVDIPAEATKVEIAISFSGHGQEGNQACAEFCNFDHHFYVNGTEHVVEFPVAGSALGCMEQVNDGTVPNQYGTWWYGRNGWCPGKEVEHVTIDITSEVTIGGTNTFDYEAFWEGDLYEGGGGNLLLTSWLVYSY